VDWASGRATLGTHDCGSRPSHCHYARMRIHRHRRRWCVETHPVPAQGGYMNFSMARGTERPTLEACMLLLGGESKVRRSVRSCAASDGPPGRLYTSCKRQPSINGKGAVASHHVIRAARVKRSMRGHDRGRPLQSGNSGIRTFPSFRLTTLRTMR